VSPLKIKFPSKNMREKPTNTPINKLNEKLVYLLVYHAYINNMHCSRSKIPSKKSRPYIYDVKFLALLGAPYIYDISRLMVKVSHPVVWK
jgi:hypothetical protein